MLRLGSPRRVKFRGQKLNLRIWRNRQFARERCLRQIQRAGQRRIGRIFFGAPSRKKITSTARVTRARLPDKFNICGYGGIGSLPVSAACGRYSEQGKGASVGFFSALQAVKKLRQPQELRGRGCPINLIFADMAE